MVACNDTLPLEVAVQPVVTGFSHEKQVATVLEYYFRFAMRSYNHIP